MSDVTALYSPRRVAIMAWLSERLFAKHMNAIRVAELDRARALDDAAGPLILYTNHPSWWDGVVYLLVAQKCFPSRRHYVPIESRMLAKYGLFSRMGAFGIDLDRPSGAAMFLRQSDLILQRADSLLWIPAQGRFSDPRERPLGLKPGVARLCERAPHATVVPVAFDYAFWSERGAEAFVAFGPAVAGRELAALDRAERLRQLEARLTETLDWLSGDVIARQPGRFDTLVAGRAGVGGIYDLWKGASARLTGGRWKPAHTEEERDSGKHARRSPQRG